MAGRTLFALLLVVAQSASAQSPQATSPLTAQERDSKGVRIVLEARSLTLSGSLDERAGVDFKLPAPGKCIVQEKKQTESLLRLASGDRRSNAGPLKTVVVPSGEEREFSPFGRSQSLQSHDLVVATADDNRQAINVKLTWAKWKDGSEHLLATTAAVPLGSNLLICTTEYFASGPVKTSAWEKFQDRLLNRKRATFWREKQRVYVLISPRITGPEGQQQPPAAK
jgi:hypothetical protein